MNNIEDGIIEEVLDYQLGYLRNCCERIYDKDLPLNYSDVDDYKMVDQEEALSEAKEFYIDQFRACFKDKKNKGLIKIERLINEI